MKFLKNPLGTRYLPPPFPGTLDPPTFFLDLNKMLIMYYKTYLRGFSQEGSCMGSTAICLCPLALTTVSDVCHGLAVAVLCVGD